METNMDHNLSKKKNKEIKNENKIKCNKIQKS